MYLKSMDETQGHYLDAKGRVGAVRRRLVHTLTAFLSGKTEGTVCHVRTIFALFFSLHPKTASTCRLIERSCNVLAQLPCSFVIEVLEKDDI